MYQNISQKAIKIKYVKHIKIYIKIIIYQNISQKAIKIYQNISNISKYIPLLVKLC